jgi:D-alanyl-D-alanine carboxypeptidase
MKRIITTLLLAVSIALLGAQTQPTPPTAAAVTSPAPVTAEKIDQVNALAAAEFANDPVGGLTVGIVEGPKLVWTKSYGFADAENKKPADRETVYRIGSITKQFTAMMLLQLVEQGKIHLTDPVEKYFPEITKVPKRTPDTPPITLLQVASMTSGLAREPEAPADHSVGPVSGWEQKVLAALPHTTYAYEPGTRYLYSNIGFASLGIALSRAAHEPFTTYVEQHILKPLGMTHTAFEPTPAIRDHIARGYSVRKEDAPEWTTANKELDGRGYRVPNGALFSTVDDLARWIAFELGDGPAGVLKKETQDELYSRVYSADTKLASGYGIAFNVTRKEKLVAIGHGGSTAGFLSVAIFDRATKTGVIVFRNVTGGTLNPTDLALKALEHVAR